MCMKEGDIIGNEIGKIKNSYMMKTRIGNFN